MLFRLYEGERPIAEENLLKSEWELQDLPLGPKGTQAIQVFMSADSNGIPAVNAVVGEKQVALVVVERSSLTQQQRKRIESHVSGRFRTHDGRLGEGPQKKQTAAYRNSCSLGIQISP